MKLRKNDYIRTNKRIFKIEDINDYDICVLDTFCELFYSHTTGTTAFFMSDKDEPYTITKSSPNIIDLIEVGDYVNGYKVLEICEGNFDSNNPHNVKALKLEFIEQNINPNVPFFKRYIFIFDKDIKSIVTKEQFKSMEYEVK